MINNLCVFGTRAVVLAVGCFESDCCIINDFVSFSGYTKLFFVASAKDLHELNAKAFKYIFFPAFLCCLFISREYLFQNVRWLN